MSSAGASLLADLHGFSAATGPHSEPLLTNMKEHFGYHCVFYSLWLMANTTLIYYNLIGSNWSCSCNHTVRWHCGGPVAPTEIGFLLHGLHQFY